MLIPPETLETARLLLRRPVPADAEPIFRKYAQDPEVTRYLTWRPHENIQVTQTFIWRCMQCWQDGSAFPWVVLRKQDAEVIGMLELRITGYQADLGYGMAREYWGNGYATEMTRAVVAWTLAQESIYRVWATCDIENLASARVLEKAGMQREGLLRRYILHPNISDQPRDSYCYAAVK
jgi:[ribosomal protein S5]-alanine N-acetyltransferase